MTPIDGLLASVEAQMLYTIEELSFRNAGTNRILFHEIKRRYVTTSSLRKHSQIRVGAGTEQHIVLEFLQMLHDFTASRSTGVPRSEVEKLAVLPERLGGAPELGGLSLGEVHLGNTEDAATA